MYPKTIKLDNDKLKKLLVKKGELITVGRAKSEEIEVMEKEMEEIEKKIMVEEAKVDIDDLRQKEKDITDTVNDSIKEMEKIKQEIFDRMRPIVPKELYTSYDELKTKKENTETERNKIAIKAQKHNDKIIPLGKSLMKPFLEDKFDDYDSIQIQDGEVVCSIFNHVEDFKTNFKKK